MICQSATRIGIQKALGSFLPISPIVWCLEPQDPYSTRRVHSLTISQPWLKLNCSLGEGPFWEEETNTIRFLDVEKCKVHRVNVDEGPSSHKVVKDYGGISIG